MPAGRRSSALGALSPESLDPSWPASPPEILSQPDLCWDVTVVGGGNAALVAAITAAEAGRRVLLLEAAPRHLRAGNTRHTRNIRAATPASNGNAGGGYSCEEFLTDLASVGARPLNPQLARMTVARSVEAREWMTAHGVRWQPALRGTLALQSTNHFFLGGGTALANLYYRLAARVGVTLLYDAKVSDFDLSGPDCARVVVLSNGVRHLLTTRSVVVACGGFEANLKWLETLWGQAAHNYVIRGTPHNDGAVLSRLLDLGAASVGDPKAFHAVAVDARAPVFDGGIVTRIDCIPFGIVVNREGRRFADEGADIWPKRYASWGSLIAAQPGQIAYAVFDSAARHSFIPPPYPPIESATIESLASQVGLDPTTLAQTVADFNAHVTGETELDLRHPDGVAATGLDPPKTNWASRIERPPFFVFPVKTGITFTYMGLMVDEAARVLDNNGQPVPRLFAAGEIMAGNILTTGYLAGFGMTIGTVFGRLAGISASSC
jgi:tricarballylate dehydrogenase